MWILIVILILVFIFKSTKNKRNTAQQQRTYRQIQQDIRKYERWQNSPVMNRHYELLEKERILYSKVHQSGNYHGPDAYRFEALCLEDISIAEEFIALCNECNQDIPSYPAFKQLAIFYEKQGNYHLAIPLCDEAIRLGFTDDGTKDGMKGRLARLEKKYYGKQKTTAE